MNVSFDKSFQKSFAKRIKNTVAEEIFWQKLKTFSVNPFESSLGTHKLSGKLRDYWSFSLQHDLRVIFFFTNDKPKEAVFFDIGTHDDVY